MSKVNQVAHARTKQTCGKCGAKILASRNEKQLVTNQRTGKSVKKLVRVLGDSYSWIKFRRGPKKVRCAKLACQFRRSDKTASDKLSRVYAAEETAEDAIAAWNGSDGSCDELVEILGSLADEAREVADEYEESADNIEEAFTGGSATAEDCRDKASQLSDWADDLDGHELEDWDGPDLGETDDAMKAAAEQELRDEEAGIKKGPRDREASSGPSEPKNSNDETHAEWVEAQRTLAHDVIGCPI